jgi:hypothetical protein
MQTIIAATHLLLIETLTGESPGSYLTRAVKSSYDGTAHGVILPTVQVFGVPSPHRSQGTLITQLSFLTLR